MERRARDSRISQTANRQCHQELPRSPSPLAARLVAPPPPSHPRRPLWSTRMPGLTRLNTAPLQSQVTPFTHSPLFSPPSLSSQPHSTALLLNPNPGDADSPSLPLPSPSSSRVKLESKYVPDFPVDLAPFTKLLKKDALFQPRHSFEVPDFKVDFEPTRAGITPSSTLPEVSLDDLSFGDDDPAFDSSSLMF